MYTLSSCHCSPLSNNTTSNIIALLVFFVDSVTESGGKDFLTPTCHSLFFDSTTRTRRQTPVVSTLETLTTDKACDGCPTHIVHNLQGVSVSGIPRSSTGTLLANGRWSTTSIPHQCRSRTLPRNSHCRPRPRNAIHRIYPTHSTQLSSSPTVVSRHCLVYLIFDDFTGLMDPYLEASTP